MFIIPTLLSLSRIPLAFCFLFERPALRMAAIILALISDGLDGYLARKYRQTTQFGAIIDPITDKFFVVMALYVLVGEQRLTLLEALLLLCRDYAVCVFSLYLYCSDNLSKYRIQAILSGKITTALQAALLLLCVWGVSIPQTTYLVFLLLGLVAFGELWLSKRKCLS